jgi:hypothetical protein
MRMAIVFSALAAFGGKSSLNGRLGADDQVFLFGYDIGYISGCLIMV